MNNNNNKLKNFLKPYRQETGVNAFHTHVGMIDGCKGIFNLGRQQFEELWELHCEETLNNPKYLSGLAEKPQNYSMVRSDIDQKEMTERTTPYEMYTVFEALNLIKEIQQYLKENIKDCKSSYLDCALLTKPPYLCKTDKGTYNKHGYHLQFINCFLSKEDNTRLGEHFHKINNTYDKVHNHPWLLYGSQKKKETGKYTVTSIVKHDGQHTKPEEYFKQYKIYDDRERVIEYNKPISWYYPRILSIVSYNRECCDFKQEMNNLHTEIKQVDFFQRQESYDDSQQYDESIQGIITKYISEELGDNLEIKESTDRGFKLRNKGTFTCPIDSNQTHSRMGAFINIHDGGVYFGCYKCRDNNNKCTVHIGRFRDSTYKNNNFDFNEVLDIQPKHRTKEQRIFLENIFTKITKNNVEYLFNVKDAEHQVEINDDGWVSKDIMNKIEKCVLVKAGLGKGKTQASTDHINDNKYEQIIVFTPRRSYARCALDRMKASCPQYDWRLYMDSKGIYNTLM